MDIEWGKDSDELPNRWVRIGKVHLDICKMSTWALQIYLASRALQIQGLFWLIQVGWY